MTASAIDAMNAPHKGDDDLCACLATDLDGTVERLVLEYQDRLYRFALRCCAGPQDAEEIVQDAFVRAYTALKGYTAERIQALALRPWLYQITLNVARNRARAREPRRLSLPTEDEGSPLPSGWEPQADAREGPEARLEQAQDSAEVARLLAATPERYRVALVLRYVEDLSYVEAAAVLNRPTGTVKSDVHRGLALLRAAMTERREEVS